MHAIEFDSSSELLSMLPILRSAFRIVHVLTPRENLGRWGIIVSVA